MTQLLQEVSSVPIVDTLHSLVVADLFDMFIKHLRSDFQTEPVTGLMLIYMKHIVHVLEVGLFSWVTRTWISMHVVKIKANPKTF